MPFLSRFTALCIVFSCIDPSHAQTALADDWIEAREIEQSIQPPRIPRRDFNITAFGPRSERGADARPAIQAAIAKANSKGGGRVIIPAGVWMSHGPIHLQSNVELHLADGATLLFGPEAKAYLPVVATRWEGTELFGYSPMIYAANVHDVAITGKGIIDGNVNCEFRTWYKQQTADQLKLRKMGIDGTPAKQRIFGAGTYLRPSLIQFFHAERVLLADFTLKNGAFWMNHLVYTSHATVRGLTVESEYANNDGVDIDSSRNVLIVDNVFRTGDDGVVVKSGRDRDGRDVAQPSENIVVRNNTMSGEDGIALGSEMSGGIRNVFFTDNVMTKGTAAIRFKANLDRGGVVEHIRVRNLAVGEFDHLLWFQLNYPGQLEGGHPSTYRDIVFENITVEHVGTLIDARAPKEAPLHGVMLKNLTVKKTDKLFALENVEQLQLDRVRIDDQTIDGTLSAHQ